MIRHRRLTVCEDFDPSAPEDYYEFTTIDNTRIRIYLIECAVVVFEKMRAVIWPKNCMGDEVQSARLEKRETDLIRIFNAADKIGLQPVNKGDESTQIWMFEPEYTAPHCEYTVYPYIRRAAEMQWQYSNICHLYGVDE
jgi:hypothetical protein